MCATRAHPLASISPLSPRQRAYKVCDSPLQHQRIGTCANPQILEQTNLLNPRLISSNGARDQRLRCCSTAPTTWAFPDFYSQLLTSETFRKEMFQVVRYGYAGWHLMHAIFPLQRDHSLISNGKPAWKTSPSSTFSHHLFQLHSFTHLKMLPRSPSPSCHLSPLRILFRPPMPYTTRRMALVPALLRPGIITTGVFPSNSFSTSYRVRQQSQFQGL